MVNLENKLTVDDLIVEYTMYKVKHGYLPEYKISEFMDFLSYFQTKMEVLDVLDNGEELFNRFFDRKIENDWHVFDRDTDKVIARPHMDIKYDDDNNDHTIKANYKLSDYDKSVINTYFMDNGMSKYDDYPGTAWEIRNIIKNYLKDQPKRVIDENMKVTDNQLLSGKYIAAEIINCIWDEYVDLELNDNKWPRQCRDINKYLIDTDLAEIIGLKSIRKELLELYKVLSKRIAVLYAQDECLKLSSYTNRYLERANYDLLINGYEKIMDIAYNKYKRALEIDLSKVTIIEKQEEDSFCDWYDEYEVITTKKKINNNDVKILVKNIDKNI